MIGSSSASALSDWSAAVMTQRKRMNPYYGKGVTRPKESAKRNVEKARQKMAERTKFKDWKRRWPVFQGQMKPSQHPNGPRNYSMWKLRKAGAVAVQRVGPEPIAPQFSTNGLVT
jgi:hypothetical protein